MSKIAVSALMSLCAYAVLLDPLSAQDIRSTKSARVEQLTSKAYSGDPKAAMDLYRVLTNNNPSNINDGNLAQLIPLWQIAARADDPAAISLIANLIFTGKGGYKMDKVFATRLWQYTASRGDDLGTFHFNNLKLMQGIGDGRRVLSGADIREGLREAFKIARQLEGTMGGGSYSQSSRNAANDGLERNANRNQWRPN